MAASELACCTGLRATGEASVGARNRLTPPTPGVARGPRGALGCAVLLILALACGREEPDCPRCGTLVIAATGAPDALLPPLVGGTVGRDISDLMFERLAVLRGGAPPGDSTAYAPGLASRWERVDSLTLRYHLRPGARWHDGKPVTSADMLFSFAAYADSGLDAAARPVLAGRVQAFAPDDSTVDLRFATADLEQWYDATWHVRILPRHVWASIPPARWADDTASARLIGSGPYRLISRGAQSLELERADGREGPGVITRVVWRFTEDQDAALNLLLSHEADLLETVGDSTRAARVTADSTLSVIPYRSAVYGFLGFNLGRGGPAADRGVRRGLAMATDRQTAARAALGPGASAPSGPMSRLFWIDQDGIRVLPFDTAAAGRELSDAGWPRGKDGVRRKAGRPLAIDIMVPGTSVARKNVAQVVQAMWRQAGVQATITSVDFPVFQQRLRTGEFESFVGAWLDEPSPRSLAEQWTSAGIGSLNYTRYRSRSFDSLYRAAAGFRGTPVDARVLWVAALDTLNADAPGIWLYTPVNLAGVTRRLQGFDIDPYSWLAGLPGWRLAGPPAP
jgi:peptide/nickel transport system substrate-binding protein